MVTTQMPERPSGAPPSFDRGDAMQASRLTTRHPAAELEGAEEIEPPLLWVALDKERGLLVCPNADLAVPEFIGVILESRVVRVMADRDGQVLCASSNRKAADTGRPGRECALCEDRSAVCFPRWWISWREPKSGRVFAHTLGRIGSLHFTRYAAHLRRVNLFPSQVITRLSVEKVQLPPRGKTSWSFQFSRIEEENDPFLD